MWFLDLFFWTTTERPQKKSRFVFGMNQCLDDLVLFFPDSLQTNTSPFIRLVTLFLLVGHFGACRHVVELC